MLLLFFYKRPKLSALSLPQFFFVRKFPFTISASRHADFILNAPEFRDRCMTFQKRNKITALQQGNKSQNIKPFFKLDMGGAHLFLVSGLPDFRRFKHRTWVTVGLCSLLIFALLRSPIVKPLGRQQTVTLPFNESIPFDLNSKGSLLRLKLPSAQERAVLISFYLDTPTLSGPIQIGALTLEPGDLQWKGKHFLKIKPTNDTGVTSITLRSLAPTAEVQHLEIRNIELLTIPASQWCNPEEVAPLSDFEKLERISICFLQQPHDEYFTLERIRTLRQSLSRQVESMQFDYVRAKNLGDFDRSRLLLAGVIRTLPDPFDPRNQQAKYLLERKGSPQ